MLLAFRAAFAGRRRCSARFMARTRASSVTACEPTCAQTDGVSASPHGRADRPGASIRRACSGTPSAPKKADDRPRRSNTRVRLLSAARRARRRPSTRATTCAAGRSMRPWPSRAAGAASWGDEPVRRVFSAVRKRDPQPGGFDFGTDAIGLMRGLDEDRLFGSRPQWSISTIAFRSLVGTGARDVAILLPLRPRRGLRRCRACLAGAHARRADVSYSLGAELSADAVFGYFAAGDLQRRRRLAWRPGSRDARRRRRSPASAAPFNRRIELPNRDAEAESAVFCACRSNRSRSSRTVTRAARRDARPDGEHLVPGAQPRHRAAHLGKDAGRRLHHLPRHGRRAQRRRHAAHRSRICSSTATSTASCRPARTSITICTRRAAAITTSGRRAKTTRRCRRDHIDRVYDTYASEDEFVDNDEWIAAFVLTLERRPYTSREFLYRLGEHLWKETGATAS